MKVVSVIKYSFFLIGAAMLIGAATLAMSTRTFLASAERTQGTVTELVATRGSNGSVLYRPVGCAACGHTGYRRRTGIYELMKVDDGLRRLIHDRAAEQSLREYAVQRGMRGLRQDGERLVVSGVTSLEELLRVTRD